MTASPDDTTAPVTAEGLRERITWAIHRYDWEHGLTGNGEPGQHQRGEANAVLAALAGDPGDLPARMAEALNSHEWEPGQRHTAHRKHNYHGVCAICQEDLPRIAEVAMSVRWEHAASQAAEVERLHSWAGLLSLLDEHWPEDIFPTEPDSEGRDPGPRIVSLLRWVERLRAELAEVKAERDTNFSLVGRLSTGGFACATQLELVTAERDALTTELEHAQGTLSDTRQEVDDLTGENRRLRDERDAFVASVRTAQITHIRETHPNRMHVANCLACHVLVPLSRDLPSRPDDPEEIRHLAQATTEETPTNPSRPLFKGEA